MHKPLAEILRPKNLDQYIGQRHLVGEGGHTHRPAIHNMNGKKRIVLGDWREHESQILEIDRR